MTPARDIGAGRRTALSLRVTGPAGTSAIVSFLGPDLKIGGAPGADLVLPGPGVAAQHCRIFERRGAQILVDRGTPGGTGLNGQRITEPTPLAEGDRISVGDHTLEVLAARSVIDPERLAARLRRGPALALTPAPALAPRPPPRRSRRTIPCLAGSLLGAFIAGASGRPPDTEPGQTPEHAASLAPPDPPPPAAPPVAPIDHVVVPGETLADVAALHGVELTWLARWNALGPAAPLAPGQRLRVYTSRPPVVRKLQRHRVRQGDSWDSLARRLGVDLRLLRAHNPRLRGALRPGDLVEVWAPPAPDLSATGEPAAPVVPPDAASQGRPHDGGALASGLLLPRHPDYELRCPYNAHASSFTARHLLTALARLRGRYRGQIVVGDLSREDGGPYGPHLSHQSGRDVDIWLPIAGGLYRTDPACRRCGTPWCRPEPHEVDWPATWDLIEALASTGAVGQIFLDRSHHPRLRAAARAAGVGDRALARAIQPRRGAPALVTHSDGHSRHMHVRFRCGPDEPSCRD